MLIVVMKPGNAGGTKEHYFRNVFQVRSTTRLVENLQEVPKVPKTDEERVRDLWRKLYDKAKQEAGFRFYVLYDKIRLPYVLREAYARCRRKNGAPGIDGIAFEDIEKGETIGPYLERIREELETKTYTPQAVKRVYIPKANGKMRPLGIPTVKDRVVQMACKMVIEPIFEADFQDCSYGFRPGRSAKDAMGTIKENLEEGYGEVYDADLSAYFDSIPHDKLLTLIGKRISDKNVLHLIKLWLKAPVSEDGRISGGKGSTKGTPQGGVISPLLANIYLNLIDKAVMRVQGVFHEAGIRIVRYADDFVLMGKRLPDHCLKYLKGCLDKMGLALNEEKTRIVNTIAESFNFLGFTIGYVDDRFGRDWKYLQIAPSKKSVQKARDSFREFLGRSGHFPPERLADELNKKIRGWVNYYSVEGVSYPMKSCHDLRYYLSNKLYRYYRRKSQRRCKLYHQGAFRVLVERYGLIDPVKLHRSKKLVNALS